MMDTHSTTLDTPAVGFTDQPQPATDYADLHAVEAGGVVVFAFVLVQWGVPWLTAVFSGLLTGWLPA